MRLEQQPAYVLHARPYRETSLLLECLSRDHGRLGVVARGARGARSRFQRAQLEPFQPLLLDLLARGELATLTAVEAGAAAARLVGQAGLAGLYVNELVVRLTARQDPHPALFDAYARVLAALAGATAASLAWPLRLFERDLLAAIGYALQLDAEADTGMPLRPTAHYRYQPESGAQTCAAGTPEAVLGEHLLALSAGIAPDAQGQRALRRLMRGVIRFHLGGGELRAWRMLGTAGGS